MSTTLEPTADRLLVEPIEAESVTKSGLLLPDTAKEKPQRGKVIALGPLVGAEDALRRSQWRDVTPPPEEGEEPRPPWDAWDGDAPLALAVGDEVLYSRFGGTELKIDLKPVVLLRECDVFCRVTEDEDGEE